MTRVICPVVAALLVALTTLTAAASDQPAESPSATTCRSVASLETISLGWYDSHRCRHVPAKIYCPAAADTRLPVIVFSPGLGRTRHDCAYLGRYWAAHGYVSVFVQHRGSDAAVWQVQFRKKERLRAAFHSPGNIRNRPLDVSFAIDQLERINREDTPLGRRLDLTRIGVAGHDFGAQTTLAIAGAMLPGGFTLADSRVKAVIAMSAPVSLGRVPLSAAYGKIDVPCLHITGTNDDGIIGTTRAHQRRLPFDHISGTDQYLVTFRGADHLIYAGHLIKRLDTGSSACFRSPLQRSSTAFWDAYLKGDPARRSWLSDGGLDASLGWTARIETKLHDNARAAATVGRSRLDLP